jgi:SNF2 family DNA or RNA helicase
VVAPLRVAFQVWPREPEGWAGSEWADVAKLKIVVLHGSRKDYLARQEADIFVINFDGLKWAVESGALAQLGCDTLIIDESTALKHTNTKRFKMLKPLFPRFTRRWILTGTPNPNGYLDLFGQFYAVDCGLALGRFVTHFRNAFFFPVDKMGWNWKLKEGAEELIQKKVAPYVFRLDAADYLELPELVENVIRVELPKDARRVYDELEEELITQLGERTVTAASAGVAAMKCAQVADGGLYHQQEEPEDWGKRTWTDIHTEKSRATKELLDEINGSPTLVVYDFKHDLARLKQALQIDFKEPPHIGGDVSPKESEALIAAWNRDELPVLLVHPQTVSHGLNLQLGTGHNIIWHSLIYDRERYDQLNRRLIRQGSRAKRVFVHHIVAINTIDVVKLRTLKKKGEVQQNFLDALKAYAKEKN